MERPSREGRPFAFLGRAARSSVGSRPICVISIHLNGRPVKDTGKGGLNGRTWVIVVAVDRLRSAAPRRSSEG